MSYIRKRKRNSKIYLEEVKSVRIAGKVVQKHIKYIGREADKKIILSSSISNVSIDKVKIYGPLLVLNHLCKEIELSSLLGKHSEEIISLVLAHCLNYKSINKMSDWFKRTDLNMILDIDNLTEERLLKALDSLEAMGMMKLQKKIFDNVKKFYKLKPKGVIYDVTNTYLYGKKCSMGKYGKDKEGVKGRPLIQIGLGVTRKEGIPVFHKTFDGNVSDSRTLNDLISSFVSYNINSGIIVYDRGIISAKNISMAKKMKWETICGMPMNNNLKKETRKLIKKVVLTDIKNRIKMNKSIFYIFHQKYIYGNNVSGELFICYNEQKAKDIRESRYDEITEAQSLLKNGKTIKSGLEKYFYKNNSLNHKIILKEEEFDGFSFIFSTKKLPVAEVMKLYFQDKDIVEKAFRSLKGVINVRPIRHWLSNRVIAHVFICHLSYLLLSLLKLRLQKINMLPLEALQELETLYKIYIKDKHKGFKLERTVALTKKQEKILRAVDKSLISKCSG